MVSFVTVEPNQELASLKLPLFLAPNPHWVDSAGSLLQVLASTVSGTRNCLVTLVERMEGQENVVQAACH